MQMKFKIKIKDNILFNNLTFFKMFEKFYCIFKYYFNSQNFFSIKYTKYFLISKFFKYPVF